MCDEEYKSFHSKLIPTVEPDLIIGVRTPVLRKFAKKAAKMPCGAEFLKSLPHKYYDENNLHAFMLEEITDYRECMSRVKEFLPYIDNWATCDMLSPKVFGKNKALLIDDIKELLNSAQTYSVRFAIVMLMKHYLDEDFKEEYLQAVASVATGEDYYINMGAAWFFATALCKQREKTVQFLKAGNLKPNVHNKAIQKAIESSRVNKADKEMLRKLKIKE